MEEGLYGYQGLRISDFGIGISELVDFGIGISELVDFGFYIRTLNIII